MTEYRGVFCTSFHYLRRSISNTVKILLTLLVVCLPTVVLFVNSKDRIGVFAIFGFLGLITYLGQLGVNDELSTIDDQTNSKVVGYTLVALVIIYYNCLIFMSVFFATTVALAGFEQYALGVAMLYPFYDIEMTEMAAPLSIGGAFVFTVTVVAWSIQAVEHLLDVQYGEEGLDKLSHLKDWESVLRDFVLFKSDRLTRRRGRSS